MTQRLPVPGGDNGTWGDILNGFLEVSLNADGTIQTAALSQAGGEVTSNKGIASGYASLNSSGLVPTTQLATGTASSSNYLRGDGTWVTPNGGSSALASDTDVTITSPASNQVLTYNSGTNQWNNLPPAVPSVFGRTGAITAASGDYTASEVGALPSTDDLSSIATANPTANNVSLNTYKLTNIANGSASTDAAAYGQLPVYAGNGGVVTTVNHPMVINVVDYGAVGNGGTDDAPAIQAAINAARYGSIVFFPPAASNYCVGSTITLPTGIRLVGAGTAHTPTTAPYSSTQTGVVIRMKNGANLDAVLASSSWYNNTPGGSIDQAIEIENLVIDGNAANQTAGYGVGIALCCYRAKVHDCAIFNTAGDGILLTNEGRVSGQVSEYLASQSGSTYDLYNQAGNGTTLGQGNWQAGSVVECFFERNIFAYNGTPNGAGTPSPGANGFHAWENPSHRGFIADNFFCENLIQEPGFDAIHLWQGGDWIIRDNHPYGAGYSNIWVFYADETAIINNFCEPGGAIASSSNIYAIYVGTNGSTAIRIHGNRIFTPSSATNSNTYYGIFAGNAYSTATNWFYTISDNIFYGGSTGSPYGTAICLNNSGTAGSTYQGAATIYGNIVGPGWATNQTTSGTGSWVITGYVDNQTTQSVGGTKTFTSNLTVPALVSTGLTGATAPSRYVGATTSGAPASGTFAVGDYIIDQTGKIWICTVAGTPGTWLQISASNATSGAPGLIQLDGDLGGTATSPTVAGVNGVVLSGTPSSGQVLTATGSAAATWSAKGNIQIFTSSGTWTQPAGISTVTVTAIGGGGGGAGGAQVASGSVGVGGGGGGGGGKTVRTIPASLLNSTETITVGAGGTAGVAATSSSSAGGNGGAGGASQFKTNIYCYAGGGSAGTGGGVATGGAGGGGANTATFYGSAGGTASSTGAGGVSGGGSYDGAAGGGAGGGITTGAAASGGAAGGSPGSTDYTGAGGAGTSGGGTGGNGGIVATGLPVASGGGGGGGSSVTGVGGPGGAGGVYGGGGGGGGASLNGNNSGYGGVGGSGLVVVWCI